MLLRLVAGAALLVWAGAAGAQDAVNATRDVTFEGLALPACFVRDVTARDARNASLSASGAGASTVALSPEGFVDSVTGVPRATEITLALPITCNAPHHLRIASTRGGLLLAGAGSEAGRFRDRIDFAVALDWAGMQRAFDTASGTGLDLDVDTAATGDAAIRIVIPGGGRPLVAGAYGDALTILVEAAS